MKNPCEPQAAQKGPDARRRGSEERGVLRCTLQRRATKPTPQMGLFQQPASAAPTDEATPRATACSTGITRAIFRDVARQLATADGRVLGGIGRAPGGIPRGAT